MRYRERTEGMMARQKRADSLHARKVWASFGALLVCGVGGVYALDRATPDPTPAQVMEKAAAKAAFAAAYTAEGRCLNGTNYTPDSGMNSLGYDFSAHELHIDDSENWKIIRLTYDAATKTLTPKQDKTTTKVFRQRHCPTTPVTVAP